jgi:hypothetical protein
MACYGIEQGHVQRTFNHFNATLIPQPSRLAPPLVPHLTGHVTGQMACQRAVTGHVTGYVRRDRFHALTPTRNKPSFTPSVTEGGTRVGSVLRKNAGGMVWGATPLPRCRLLPSSALLLVER